MTVRWLSGRAEARPRDAFTEVSEDHIGAQDKSGVSPGVGCKNTSEPAEHCEHHERAVGRLVARANA